MWTIASFGIVGIIHILPASPIFLPNTLTRLYGVAPEDDTLLLLLRHRAMLLALVGILCFWAAWSAAARPAALVAATLNVVGFLSFYARCSNPSPALRKIAITDLFAVPPLAVAAYNTLVLI